MSVRKPVLIGLGFGMAGVCAIAWLMLHMPKATGRMLTGVVLNCGEQKTGLPWKLVAAARNGNHSSPAAACCEC